MLFAPLRTATSSGNAKIKPICNIFHCLGGTAFSACYIIREAAALNGGCSHEAADISTI